MTKFFNTHYTLDLKCSFTWFYNIQILRLMQSTELQFCCNRPISQKSRSSRFFSLICVLCVTIIHGCSRTKPCAHIGHNGRKSFLNLQSSNLFMTSKNEYSNSPIHEFKVLLKSQRAFIKPLFNGVLLLIRALTSTK